ncbi:hypothetical protein WJX84_007971 [Apatococcus fuscideae]|uniref:Negatively light-regulated protein n=1 Tax=Apatococcus fuscideae TaxID=2026836 RepID=A0AAW1TA76_9CHLO
MSGPSRMGPGPSANDIMKQQEEMLKQKYGGLQPKKKLMPKDHKYFDSADWALSKQGIKTEQVAAQEQSSLEPKLEPSVPHPRRTSHLGEED